MVSAANGVSNKRQKIKNVVVLGGSYSGARAAESLSSQLPDDYRVIMVDRQSHFNHLYKYVRYSVVPGHAHKAFIPYTNLLHAPLLSPDSCPASDITRSKNLIIQANVINLTPTHIEIDKELCEIEGITEAEEIVYDELHEVIKKKGWAGKECYDDKTGKILSGKRSCSGTRIPYEFMIYALGSHLPRPLASPARTKKENINFLKAQQDAIYKATSILIVGGGALGVQYATDIKELYPHKHVTLIHSRPRLMPVFDQRVHDEVVKRFQELNIELILGDRVILPPSTSPLEEQGHMTIKTQSGRSLESDLRIFATGQKPNSALMATLSPESLNEQGYVKVKRTMQICDPKFPRIFSVGDVIDGFGAIKAGHTGWNQANTAIANVLALIQAQHTGTKPEFQEYQPGKPMIKLTLGLTRSVTQLVTVDDPDQIEIKLNDDHDIDPYWEQMWAAMKADPEKAHE